jgi:hypothetical protein
MIRNEHSLPMRPEAPVESPPLGGKMLFGTPKCLADSESRTLGVR